jgi:hypothetical protein
MHDRATGLLAYVPLGEVMPSYIYDVAEVSVVQR